MLRTNIIIPFVQFLDVILNAYSRNTIKPNNGKQQKQQKNCMYNVYTSMYAHNNAHHQVKIDE